MFHPRQPNLRQRPARTPAARRLPVVLLTALTLACLGPSALGQVGIELDTIRRPNLLTDPDKKAVNRYLDRWIGVFNRASLNPRVSDAEISEARDRLLGPVRTVGMSDAFASHYADRAAKSLVAMMASDRLAIRLNTMIVATRLPDDATARLAVIGLKDPAPGVRYWAAKALTSLLNADTRSGRPILDTQARLLLIQELQSVGKGETSVEALREILAAMTATGLPSAAHRVLELLESRLVVHANNPDAPCFAEAIGLRDAYRALLDRSIRGTATLADLRKLAGISQRYMHQIAANLAADPKVDNEQLEGRTLLIEIASIALNFCHEEAKITQPPPADTRTAIDNQQWNQVLTIAVDGWGALLRGEPFNFTDEELSLDAP